MRKFFLVCLCSLFLLGCVGGGTQYKPTDYGNIMVLAELDPSTTSTNTEWTAHLVFTRGKHSVSESLLVSGNELRADLRIPIGTWDVEMILVDSNGEARFQDKISEVTIVPDKTQTVELFLKPADGALTVTIDLENYISGEVVMRVRVHINDTIKEITRENNLEPLTGTYSLPPGSYDLKFELFTESFRSSDKIHEGICNSITVLPGQELAINWLPEYQELLVVARVYLIPEAPENLVITETADGIFVSWSPCPSIDIQGYNVYWQPHPFSRFEPLNEEPITDLEFFHDYSSLEKPPAPTVNYTVAAVSTIDLVGYRSRLKKVTVPSYLVSDDDLDE